MRDCNSLFHDCKDQLERKKQAELRVSTPGPQKGWDYIQEWRTISPLVLIDRFEELKSQADEKEDTRSQKKLLKVEALLMELGAIEVPAPTE